MILSASRRTDIPAFYSEWFYRRLQAGYVLVPNPKNLLQVSRVSLSPEVVDCIVFWTKNPLPMLPYLDNIEQMGHRVCFQFTVTPYDRNIEPYLPDKPVLEEAFVQLSRRIGRERIFWRYDPILLNSEIDISYHGERFQRLCEKFSDYTNSVTISFVDCYRKLSTHLIRPMTTDEMASVAKTIGAISRKYGLPAKACCEKIDLQPYGVAQGSCLDPKDLEAVCGGELAVPKERNQRPGCRCCASVEIGMYDTCGNGCVYCYANSRPGQAAIFLQSHDPQGEMLVGKPLRQAVIKERVVGSHLTYTDQINLFGQ